jgi:formylglycine-generating enzyme required for sulfatase activity
MRPTKVGSYVPNNRGLFDMHGNAWQWCEGLYEEKGSERVVRGGCWFFFGSYCRAAYRLKLGPTFRNFDLAFRLVRVTAR